MARHTTQAANGLERAANRLPDLPAMLGIARQRLDDHTERHALALPNYMAGRRARLERQVLRHPRDILVGLRGRVDLLGHRLAIGLPNLLRGAQRRLDTTAHRLPQPQGQLQPRQAALALAAHRLQVPMPARLKDASTRLYNATARLESASYERVLARGFALVTTSKGEAVTSAAAVKPGAALRLRFADGKVEVKASASSKPDQLDLGL